jgi:signal transduction histidine kinase
LGSGPNPARGDGAGFERLGRGAFFVLGFVPVVLTGALLWAAARDQSDDAWVDHTHEVIAAIGDVDRSVSRAESSARAYMVSRDESRVSEFIQNRAEAESGAEHLRQMMADNPAQQSQVDHLSATIGIRLAFIERNLNLLREGIAIDAIASAYGTEGQQLVSSLNGEFNALRTAQEHLLTDRLNVRRRTKRILIALCVTLMLVSLGVAFRGDYMIRKYRDLRDHAEEQLKLANEKLEMRVRERTEELEHSNTDLRQFAFAASHDLNEPLRTIGIYSDLLRERYAANLDGDARQVLGFILKGVARMNALLDGLRTYMQVSALRRDAAPRMNLQAGVEAALLDLKGAVQASGASVACDELPAVKMHAIHARQIFQNLIGNAIKYRREDAPEISISRQESAKEWVIQVRDNGIGIDPRYQTQIFGLFKRLHPADEIPGSGLGLAICRTIVQSYGGRIWVESELGKGSTFCFTLPRVN